MEPRGIVKAFPKRKKVRDDSGKSVPPKIPKEGMEKPEGKSLVPMVWEITVVSRLTGWRYCAPKDFFWPLSAFSVEVWLACFSVSSGWST